MRDNFPTANIGSDQTWRSINGDSHKVIRWKPPDDKWKKVNIDGVVCQFLGSATVGGIIRDQEGMLDGLQLAWNLKLDKVIFEIDSKEAVQAIQ
ncbi:hypothetical protein PVK06_005663 [Gossypium arboreum]|uniref:RNase H type-1 domain-containing protein n=1 Tax=Gossypium arboreum TaxID=29729 RepID=A0ABR0QW48_GOSAR|nr:hypothetical protein PVK06_005663 [Gossypium arboreum]